MEVHCSGDVVDAVETVTKKHFATGRFACHCENVNAYPRADKCDHLAMAHDGRVRNVRYIDSQKIRRWLPYDGAPPAANDCL